MRAIRTASLILFSLLLMSFFTSAQTLTQAQMNQLKNMSAQERQRLAQQMGIDVSSLQGMGLGQSQSGVGNMKPDAQSRIYPRGTQFDEFGNPLDPHEREQQEMLEDEEDDELKLYGSQLFANAPSTFSPVADTPVPANYIIGPSDELVLQLYGKENQEYRLAVTREGTIVIPKLGPVTLAGKSFSEAKSYLAELIKRQIIGVEVSVSMGELRTMRVFVMGEAHKPGAYNVSSLSTMTHALFVSGGVTEIASLRNIQLKRGGKLVQTLDLYDLLNAGDASKDALLQSGDVVFIPAVEKTVIVDGQVRRPAIYELKHEETLSEVIKLAGGKLPEGYDRGIGVKRFTDGVQMQLTVDLTREDIRVQNGDEVRIARVAPQVTNAVTLIGAVARPGNYQWHEDLRISDLLGNRKESLLETADTSYVLILRDQDQSGELDVLQTDLAELSLPERDLLLAPNDKVLVFSRIESESMGDIKLEDLAFTDTELDEKEKEKWQQRIEEKLFWQQIGLREGDEEQGSFDNEMDLLSQQSLIELTEAERENILEYKDATYFSRKRMLTPVIAKLREQARLGQPLKLVEIVGEVKVPGVYPLAEDAKVLDLIKAAGGLTESSYGYNSEITRTVINDKGVAEITHVNFSPKSLIEGDSTTNVSLESKDRVNIFTIPSWQEDLRVTIQGEVEFPGEYTIRRGENLSDLLRRAGGLTEYGDPQAAVFTREDLKEQERKNLVRLAEELRKQIASQSLRKQSGAGSIVSYSEAKELLRDLTRVQPVGRLVIDLAAIAEGRSQRDVELEDGDVLYIPGRSQSVNVIGEVYVPTSHLYTADASFEDYITRSGGYKSLADEDRAYIIRADGSVSVPNRDGGFWFSSDASNEGIRPGDTIVVPFDSEHVDNTTLWTNATQIIYQLAVAVAAIGSL
ncbi:SLBB domain-containing protein [Lacimicrobium sp. SS2-24]|uniref:SLBB domain-containing protein n=1 Tax=Lacimicrobium sp. SS2-24 TaxID=2005569 RepID=UPI000B4BB253|nr:SLBB domain-containing protein [Lacimicrobium sp. SS2-24]